MRHATLLASAAVAALLAGPAVTACGAGVGAGSSGATCTLVGCLDGVTIHLDDVVAAAGGTPVRVTTCIDGSCSETEFDPTSGVAPLLIEDRPGLGEGSLRPTVSVTVTDGAGRLLAHHEERVRLEESRPNGPRCPPECVTASVRVEPTSG